MQKTAILFTKVEKNSTYQNCTYSELLFLCSPDYEQHETAYGYKHNQAGLHWKLSWLIGERLTVNHFLMTVWKFSPRTYRRNITASSFSFPPFLIHSTSALPYSLQLCPGCYQLITDRYYTWAAVSHSCCNLRSYQEMHWEIGIF